VTPYEIIFVNDGSTDDSEKIIARFCENDSAIKLINFSRNFGHQNALLAGLKYAQGKAAILMDADMQDPPELIPFFYQKWKEGYRVVYGIRKERRGSLILRLCYKIFYLILRKISYIGIPLDAGDFCLMDREVYSLINQLPENIKFIRGLRSWAGAKQIGIPYKRPARTLGKSKYSLLKLIHLAVNGITSFSFYPLYMISLAGFITFILSLVGIVIYVLRKFIHIKMMPGFSSIMVTVLFFAGLQMIFLGIIALYLANVYQEIKKRPRYIIKNVRNIARK
ncbi:MAG: glycosyltransferase family 2 protein, partial [Nanoarchaeota archaeon]|nr:glycosyltransferase family 2 protein [Nanoarchaeota archaeon]